MNELPSTEFRKTFAKLEEETLVTVNGHGIGYWTPHRVTDEFVKFMREHDMEPMPPGTARVPANMDPTIPAVSRQAQRDELLRKINRSK